MTIRKLLTIFKKIFFIPLKKKKRIKYKKIKKKWNYVDNFYTLFKDSMQYGMVMWRKCKTGVKGALASQRPPMASHRLRGGARSLPRPPLQPFALPPPHPHAPLSPSLKPQRTPSEAEADHPPGHFLFSYSLYFLACITT